MKKLLVILLVLVLVLSGCTGKKTEETNEDIKDSKAFEVESSDGFGLGNVYVIRHKETGKRFIIYSGYQKGGIAPLD